MKEFFCFFKDIGAKLLAGFSGKLCVQFGRRRLLRQVCVKGIHLVDAIMQFLGFNVPFTGLDMSHIFLGRSIPHQVCLEESIGNWSWGGIGTTLVSDRWL